MIVVPNRIHLLLPRGSPIKHTAIAPKKQPISYMAVVVLSIIGLGFPIVLRNS
jgi:hypothetical protein